MCGRFVSASTPAALAAALEVDEVRAEERRANYNVTPRTEVPIVAETAEHHRVLDRVRWGLIPSWAKDAGIGDRLINARGDTVAEKPSFRRAFAKRRCLIPVDGFYEWSAVPGRKTKQPYYISRCDGAPLVFAGLYEVWRDPAGGPDAPWLRTCAIITTDANEVLAPIHNRMPVVLERRDWDAWLDPGNHDTEALRGLLVPAPANEFQAWPVSTDVNRPANNRPELIERVEPPVVDAAGPESAPPAGS